MPSFDEEAVVLALVRYYYYEVSFSGRVTKIIK